MKFTKLQKLAIGIIIFCSIFTIAYNLMLFNLKAETPKSQEFETEIITKEKNNEEHFFGKFSKLMTFGEIEEKETLEKIPEMEMTENEGKESENTEVVIPNDESVQDMNIYNKPEGNAGRLYLGDWSVALYYADGTNVPEMQAVVDRQDSAVYAYNSYFKSTIIADHSKQGFGIIKNYGVGSIMTIVKDGIVQDYRCISYYGDGYAYDGDGYLPDGRTCYQGDSAIFTQTCNNSSGTSLTYQYWEPVE